MFDWFEPYCPCDPAAKAWVERRLLWLSEQFPSNIFTDRPLILPTDEFFPLPYEPSKRDARILLSLVCRYMDVSRRLAVLRFNHEPAKVLFVNDSGRYLPLVAGLYERRRKGCVITLDTDQLFEPAHLITTMAHELAHARLIGEKRERYSECDSELLTDLTSFFPGFAIFAANSPRAWDSGFSKWPGTDFNKPEYMTTPMFGYALAHLAWFQGRRKPSWKQYLGPQVINDFKDAVRFL